MTGNGMEGLLVPRDSPPGDQWSHESTRARYPSRPSCLRYRRQDLIFCPDTHLWGKVTPVRFQDPWAYQFLGQEEVGAPKCTSIS